MPQITQIFTDFNYLLNQCCVIMQNASNILLNKKSSFWNGILVENNKITNLNPFRDEISSSISIFYFVPTALFGVARFLSTNILSLVGQVRFCGKNTICITSAKMLKVNFIYFIIMS